MGAAVARGALVVIGALVDQGAMVTIGNAVASGAWMPIGAVVATDAGVGFVLNLIRKYIKNIDNKDNLTTGHNCTNGCHCTLVHLCTYCDDCASYYQYVLMPIGAVVATDARFNQ